MSSSCSVEEGIVSLCIFQQNWKREPLQACSQPLCPKTSSYASELDPSLYNLKLQYFLELNAGVVFIYCFDSVRIIQERFVFEGALQFFPVNSY